MPWQYSQGGAIMKDPQGSDFGYRWYAGRGAGKNNPAMDGVVNTGPLPVGAYQMGIPLLGSHLGPIVIPLNPMTGTNMKGRSSFYIHFDNPAHPGESSDGCIVVQVNGVEAILKIWGSGDHLLYVYA